MRPSLLLAVAGGGRAFSPTHWPHTGDSWVRSGSNPLLSPAVAWEETAVYEPTVLYRGVGDWVMLYSGGWSNPGIGLATSANGTSWTKYASNPVLGQGGSGVAGIAVRQSFTKVGSTYYCYYADANPNANLKVATSSDLITWTVQGTALASNVVGWCTGWANSAVWKEGSNWYMLVEGRSGSIWEMAYATSADGLSWTLGNSGNQLTTLQVASGGMYGGPALFQVGTLYHLWYHAAPGSGSLPTNIYHATSTDRITWTKTTPSPVLTHTGSGFEVDQVADPSMVVVGGSSYLFYDGDDNASSAAHVLLATAPAA
jgi:predicted GH43/DUF377 family glycosyl hydrolase